VIDMVHKFTCMLCDAVKPDKEGMMVFYDKDTNVMICKTHIRTR
jgi:hypothetical protein